MENRPPGKVLAVFRDMKIGIPERQGRVSPVFDSARHLWLIHTEEGRILSNRTTLLYSRDPLEKARQVARFGVEVLVCGVISWPPLMVLSSMGVTVFPCICGSVEEVLAACAEGRVADGRFQMPGTHRWAAQIGRTQTAAPNRSDGRAGKAQEERAD